MADRDAPSSAAGRLAALDMMLTDVFLNLASDLFCGPQGSSMVDKDWIIYRDVIDFATFLENMIEIDDIGGALRDLAAVTDGIRTYPPHQALPFDPALR